METFIIFMTATCYARSLIHMADGMYDCDSASLLISLLECGIGTWGVLILIQGQ